VWRQNRWKALFILANVYASGRKNGWGALPILADASRGEVHEKIMHGECSPSTQMVWWEHGHKRWRMLSIASSLAGLKSSSKNEE
jgi:hypothetical protein